MMTMYRGELQEWLHFLHNCYFNLEWLPALPTFITFVICKMENHFHMYQQLINEWMASIIPGKKHSLGYTGLKCSFAPLLEQVKREKLCSLMVQKEGWIYNISLHFWKRMELKLLFYFKDKWYSNSKSS